MQVGSQVVSVQRCSLCRDVPSKGAGERCSDCGVESHLACLREAGACGTLGCGSFGKSQSRALAGREQSQQRSRRRPPRPLSPANKHAALGSLLLIALAGAGISGLSWLLAGYLPAGTEARAVLVLRNALPVALGCAVLWFAICFTLPEPKRRTSGEGL